MTFVDSNIPMWLIEAAHPHKTEAQLLLERVICGRSAFGCRFRGFGGDPPPDTAIDRREAIGAALHGVRSILSFDSDFDRWPGLQRIHRI